MQSKSKKFIAAVAIAFGVATFLQVTGVTSSSKPSSSECLDTKLEYQFCVDQILLALLTSETMQAIDGQFEMEVFDAGAISASTIYYTHTSTGEKHILLSAFVFPAEKFDAAANPNEPPLFGQEVIRENGIVFSVAGPHDSMFEPDSIDGKNITALYELMYNQDSWVK